MLVFLIYKIIVDLILAFPVTSRVNSSVSRETDTEQQNLLVSGIDEQKGSQHQSNFVHQFGLSSYDESTIDVG